MKMIIAVLVLSTVFLSQAKATTLIEMEDQFVSENGSHFDMGCNYTVYRNGKFSSTEYATYSCSKAMQVIKGLYVQYIKDEELLFNINGKVIE
ncbi:hypothetical protein OGY35_23975 [Citrobacter sp. Ct235]|uniref:hypothetical protein n=1 Tax=Citrobacter sp. Ct235 TaxID=2985157 RepID=UPI0025778AC1|nr:hypothetical protein [Citrobacter sp. Ct235]MDM2738414.1 hypothetical protein [Citrobacter sp. Ct235]